MGWVCVRVRVGLFQGVVCSQCVLDHFECLWTVLGINFQKMNLVYRLVALCNKIVLL